MIVVSVLGRDVQLVHPALIAFTAFLPAPIKIEDGVQSCCQFAEDQGTVRYKMLGSRALQ